ncbi:hypothetical protein HY634_00085 [Candidatus Uhrbacteria bacterium]|nr:hypothetical protein [Candidatus Uhrbacteria bacterium]
MTDGSKDEPKKDKVAELRDRLEEAGATVRTREQELADAKTEAQTAKAQERLDRAKAKVAELQTKLRVAEVDAKYAQAQEQLRAARAAVEEIEDEGLATPETRERFERIILAAIEELINARATTSRISGRIEKLAGRIRGFVLANPTGWVAGVDDPEQQYLCYLSPDGRFQVILEDNPLYELTVDDLVKLIGFEAAMKLLKVNYTAVRDAAKDGILKGTDGTPVDLDRIRELRTRTERTKKVKALVRGPERVEEIVEVVAPELREEFVEKLETLGLDGNIVNALKASGITRVGQVRCLSGDDLAKIKGIGPARAAEIIRSVVKRAA